MGDAGPADATPDAPPEDLRDVAVDAAVEAEVDLAVDAADPPDLAADAEGDLELLDGPPPDRAVDAAVDAVIDAGADAVIDAGADAVIDAAPDVVDAAPDVVDAAPDVVDAAPDAIIDAEPDAEPDVVDAAPDVVDAAPDAIIDAEPDLPIDAEPDLPIDAEPDAGPPPLAPPVITEIMARNDSVLLDEDGEASDWIEVHNPNPEPLSLADHHLSDDRLEPEQWTFPGAVTLPPFGYVVVFASGKNRLGAELHTNFRLAGDGDYLSLAGPDGVLQEFDPFPRQLPDVAYGFISSPQTETLLEPDAPLRYIAPTPEIWNWFTRNYDDDDWNEGVAPLGFDEGPAPRLPVPITDSVSQFRDIQGFGGWRYGYWLASADADGVFQTNDFAEFHPVSWTGDRWVEGAPLELNASGGHPRTDRRVQWAVRRWLSSHEGRVRIYGTLDNPGGAGDGVTGRIFVDGVEVFAAAVDGARQDYSVEVDLVEGAIVDLALDPNGDQEGDGSLFTAEIEVPGRGLDALGPTVADAAADWSAAGAQGTAGWTYGYYDETADADDYGAEDFELFPEAFWNGTLFAWSPVEAPVTRVGRDVAHPNGIANGGVIHWAMRRWTSDVEGNLLLRWTMAMADPTGGGVFGRVFHEGHEVDFVGLAGDDLAGVERLVVIPDVQIGDRIDFAIDPAGDDVGDDLGFTATLSQALDLNSVIATPVETPGAFIRIPFELPPGHLPGALRLSMRYDDGFVAWLNGEVVAFSNMPGGLVWNSPATEDRAASASLVPEIFPVQGTLFQGRNMLALQALDAADERFLIEATLEQVRVGLEEQGRYLPVPTPGADNLVPDDHGPLVIELTRDPEVSDADPIEVSATVVEVSAPLAEVTLVYRVMFEPEIPVPMQADGETFRAEIPPDPAGPGQMVRWYLLATDQEGRTTREPPFEAPLDSEEYYGTAIPDGVVTELPVLRWFVQNPAGANNNGGTRSSLWWRGELYDNVKFDLHGQSTRGFPKKSHDIDFNRDHRFELREDIRRVKDVNMLTNWADKSKLRNTIAYELFADAEADHHLAFHIRVERNSAFYALYEFVEDPDDRWLTRMGYPEPVGALYKMYNRFDRVSGVEKKTRKFEGNADLQAIVEGIRLDPEARRIFIYDNVDFARMANYLAASFLTSAVDCCHKNYYAYRDTEGTGEWWMLPWDVDLSFGRVWTGSYFDDRMYTENRLFIGRDIGASNVLLRALYEIPEFVEIYLRRTRSLADALVQPPGPPPEALRLENRVAELHDYILADADLDNASWPTWGEVQTVTQGVDIMINEYLGPRRQYIYGTLASYPAADHLLFSGEAGATLGRWSVPTEDDPAWLEADFDDSLWPEEPMGLGYEDEPDAFAELLVTRARPQDVDPAATSLQVRVPFITDVTTAALTLRMKYDDGFIAWIDGVEVARSHYEGEAAWDGNALDHPAEEGVLFEDFALGGGLPPGEHLLAIQVWNTSALSGDLLVLPELIDVHEAIERVLPEAQGKVVVEIQEVEVSADAPERAYVLLANPAPTAIDITNYRLEGEEVTHRFTPGTAIPANGTLYVAGDAKAFRARPEGPSGGQGLLVQGNWVGTLTEGPLAVVDPEGTPVSP